MLEYFCYVKGRNGNLPVSFEIPVAEAKVATDVWYFDMVETFRDKLLCAGKGPVAELTKPYPISKSSDAESMSSKSIHMLGRRWSLSLARVISPHLAASRSQAFWMLISLRHCGMFDTQAQGEVCIFFLIWVEKSETRGKKYNLVANAFFSWVSFLKKILSKFW
jgi:hypothetical protein